MTHWSSCAVHNEPALPAGQCDCDNTAPESNVVQFIPRPNHKRELNALELSAIDIIGQITREPDIA